MLSFVPRDLPVKKQEELAKREYELQQAVQHNFIIEKLRRAVANYRKAQLSYFKAALHVIREKSFQGIHYSKKENVEIQIEKWTIRTDEEIINGFKKQSNHDNPSN